MKLYDVILRSVGASPNPGLYLKVKILEQTTLQGILDRPHCQSEKMGKQK